MCPSPSPNNTTTTTTTTSSSSPSHPHHRSFPPPPPPPATAPPSSSSSSTQACASCKYQRRKCQPNCTLAPYFPADQQQTFLNAHRLFGVSNILKTLKGLNPSHHRDAMRSIIYHSNVRAQDPVLGCVGVIFELQRLITQHTAELDVIVHQLNTCRTHFQAQALDISNLVLNDRSDDSANVLGDNSDAHNAICYGVHEDNVAANPAAMMDQQQDEQQYYGYHYNNQATANDNDAAALSFINHKHEEVNEQMLAPSVFNGEFFDVKEQSFFMAENEDQPNISHPSFNCKSGFKVELKEEPNCSEHDLKDAASLFTLTHYDSSPV